MDSITIKIPDRIKTTGLNRNQPYLKIPFFREQPKLCAASTLQVYISRTKDLRPESENRLIITNKKPNKAATSQSISRWIKGALCKSGIDTEIFSAHSTRHASTSAACRRGVNIETIRKAASWTQTSNVFARFYNRPVVEAKEFANSIVESFN